MNQNPFTFESEESETESQYENSLEFFGNEYEDEFNEYEGEYGESQFEEEMRRPRGEGRGPASSFRFGPRNPHRPRGPQRRYPPGFPFPRFFGTSINFGPYPETSELVRVLQSLLNKVLGLNLMVNGRLDVETRSAIRSFQSGGGQQGGAGDSSAAEPDAGADAPDSAADSPAGTQSEFNEYEFDFELEEEVNRQSPEYGRWIQQSLNKILGLRLTVDGIVGAQTRSAVRSFQEKQGLTADGVVGPMTEDALVRAGAGQPPQSSGSYTPTPSIPSGPPDVVSVRGIKVARQIAPQVEALLSAAERDGVKLSGGGFRTSEQQIQLRIAHCGGNTHYNIYEKPSSQCTPPTAPPGKSNHEKGLAIDFTYNGQGIETHSNPGFIWLANNAQKYGLYNLPSEPWHWSINGK